MGAVRPDPAHPLNTLGPLRRCHAKTLACARDSGRHGRRTGGVTNSPCRRLGALPSVARQGYVWFSVECGALLPAFGHKTDAAHHDVGRIFFMHRCSTDRPQVVQQVVGGSVNKLLIKFSLQAGNAWVAPLAGLSRKPFLPTMKSQLSQLPMIVGSGRVAI